MQVEAILAKFENAEGRRAQFYLHQIEAILAPQEFLALSAEPNLSKLSVTNFLRYFRLHRQYSVSERGRINLLNKAKVTKDLLKQLHIQPYERSELVPGGANFYSNGTAGKQKRLLVCFPGKSKRLNMPVPAFLQRIDAEKFDVLVFQDAASNHYRTGIVDKSGCFEDLADLVEKLIEKHKYQQVYALGASMGGLAAIRFGLLTSCNRAICIGGRPPNDAARLYRGETPTPRSFDPVCDCMEKRSRNLLFIYAEHHSEDRMWANDYAKRGGGVAVMVSGIEKHSLLGRLWKDDRLAGFLDFILGAEIDTLTEHYTWR